MHEIAQGIYLETGFIGVTLGAISLPHGLLLIDAPPRPEDVRSWRGGLLNLGGGVERMVVSLDAHIDRSIGARAMECTVVAHEITCDIFRNRPTALKFQDVQTGAEWELCNGLGNIRWTPPDISFSQRMLLYWDDEPIALDHHPGSHEGAVWVGAPAAGVVFIGDAVIPGQPPFLSNANLPVWIDALKSLLAPPYQNYLMVGGRTGLVTAQQVQEQISLLTEMHEALEDLAAHKAAPEATETLIPRFYRNLIIPEGREELFKNRLRWGLLHYYQRRYLALPAEEAVIEAEPKEKDELELEKEENEELE